MEALKETRIAPDGARYFPAASGIYDVKPGLVPLGTDMGNGDRDGQVFQFDEGFADYRRAKLAARSERLGKYYQTRDFGAEVMAAVCGFAARRLAEEHAERFALEEGGAEMALRCAPTGETLRFDGDMQKVEGGDVAPAYVDPFDALASQVQEDLAVVRRVDGRDWTCAIHLCSPYRWTAEEKIGLDFVTMHLPVPGMENFRRPGMVNVMVQRGPLVRFVWELTTDRRLNHHREPPPGVDPEAWKERPFDAADPRLFLRVEREVVWSFPEQEAALLAVRVYFRDGEEIRNDPELSGPLCAAIESMSPESLAYKGLAQSRDDILGWLRSG